LESHILPVRYIIRIPKNRARISEYFLTIEIIIPPIRNPKRYPPVGPKSAFRPPFPPAKTGRPIPPRSKYDKKGFYWRKI